MAEELLETVERLQSRILDNPEPRKLLKTLKRLGEVPMTVDILVETGVGKTVNSFRKHEVVGELAKSLVAKWKKLVPQSADRPNSHAKDASRSHAVSQGHEAGGHRRYREPSPEEEPSYMEEEEEEEERGYHTSYSPSPPQQDQYSPPQQRGYHLDEYEEEEPEPSPPPPPPPPPPQPPRKDVHHAKASKEPSKNHHHKSKEEERQQRHSQMAPDRGGGGEGKKYSGDKERQKSPLLKTAKHSKKSTTHDSKRQEKKKGGDDGRQRAPKDSPSKEDEEDFETPTMSFESFLTYDAPTPVKKKKKPPPSSSSSSHGRPSHSSSSSSSAPRHSRTSSPASSSSKSSKSNGAQSSKRPHSDSSSSAAAPRAEKRKRVVEALPTLPDIPLPAIQPNYRPLPSIDTPLSPQRRKVPAYNDEEDAGFTGKRFNSKMVVYSGSKTSYLPRMMTLYEQCIRVLQNNIDSIAEVGGVPFEILEPVLERCTPEQLYRIEQSNQCFTEDSDELWKRHCRRDFKRESPQEFESWREMYLRLYEAREDRLRMLTQNITSAHANKPKGRQVKMAYVNSVAKPPRDVRRRQEKFGTSSNLSTAASTAAASPIKVRPATSDYSGESSQSSSSQPPAGPSRFSAASGGLGGGVGGAVREKPQVKKIAPMMAKTIKAFKNRFSRR